MSYVLSLVPNFGFPTQPCIQPAYNEPCSYGVLLKWKRVRGDSNKTFKLISLYSNLMASLVIARRRKANGIQVLVSVLRINGSVERLFRPLRYMRDEQR